MTSYLDEHFENTWEFLEDTLQDLKRIFEGTKRERMDDARIMRLYAIADGARHLRGSRRDIERALQSGKAPTDEEIKAVHVFEKRLFQQLEYLEELEDEEKAMLKQRTAEKGEGGQ